MPALWKTVLLSAAFIPLSLVVLNIWLWIFYNIFNLEDEKNHFKRITIIMGLFSGLSIVFYPKIINFIGLSNLDFTTKSNTGSFDLIFFFWLYLSLIVIIVKTFLSKFRYSKFFILNFLSFSIIFLVGGFFGSKMLTQGAMLYYVFVALGEEFAKYLLGVNFYERRKISSNDIIVFSILSALGFAFVENFIYLLPTTQETITAGIIGGTGLLISRGIIGFIVHILFTGNIGFFSLKSITKQTYLFLLFGIIFGVGLHYFYNLFIEWNFQFVTVFAILIGYFWISYLFYQSNSIYVQSGI